MSKYIAIFVFLFSVNSVLCEYRKEVPSLVIPGDEKEEPSLQLIKLEDREEGYENLTCKDPKSPDNTVTPLSGHTPHLGSEIKVTCDVGKHFTGKPSNITAVTVTCLPLPHPCMCMAAWETKYNYMLMYDFNCTSELVENNAPADVTEQGKEEVEQEYVANNAHQPIDEPLGDEIEQNIDVQDSVDINDAIQIYSYGPEEDVDITYHETNIEVTDAENIIVNDNELGLEQDRVEYNEIREFSEENNGYYLTNDEEERDVVVEKETENEDHTNEENASDEVSAMDSDRYNIELPDQTSTFDISSENLNFVEIEEEISEDGETETMHKENNDFVTSELEEIFEEQIGIPEDISEANIQEREEYDKVVEEMEEIENENISDKNEYHLEPKYTVEQEKEEIGIVEKDPETQFEEAEEEWLEEEDSVREAEQETNEAIVDEMYQFETTTIKEPKYTVEQEKEEIGIVEKDPETQFEETEEEWLEENDSVREAEQETNEAIVDEMYQFETTTIKESGWFDKEDTVGEDEDVDRNRMLFEEIEPPGYMTDIQMFPFQASKHEVRTEEDAVCSLVAATGPCRAYFRRYFFNSKTQECDIFVYGGCIGNGNNFKTSLDCENTCMNNMNSLSNNDINIKTEPL